MSDRDADADGVTAPGGSQTRNTRVAALCGSLRDRSYSRIALGYVLREVEEAGATGELIDLREFDLPPMNADLDEQGDSARLTTLIREADAVVLGTPMYHGSYSGVLKNALDYCGFDEFDGKTVGLLAVAGGGFPVTALEHLRSVCRALNAWVIPHQAAIPRASRQFERVDESPGGDRDHDGWRFVDEELERRVRVLGRRAVEFAYIEPDPATPESGQNVGARR